MAINKDNNMDDSLNNAEQGQELHANLNAASASAKKSAEATDKQTKATEKHTKATEEGAEGVAKFAHKMKEGEEALDEFNDALNALPGRLHLITQQMNKNMMFVSGELHDSFIKGKLTEKLWEVKKAFGEQKEELDDIVASAKKAVAAAEQGTDEQAKQAAQRKLQQAEEAQRVYSMMTDAEKLNAKLSKEMTAELLKLGKQMFSDLWNYAKGLFDAAYNDVKNTVKQSYGTVMSYNSYSQGEYAKVIDTLKDKIEKSGLGSVISVDTLQENLVKTLQTGLQGALAETNAYYASIAEKAGITFDWYGTEWTSLISQMSRTGKDYEAVMKSVITTTDDIMEIYGDSKGLSEGRANQYMSAASKLGTTYNLDDAAISNIYKSMAITSQELSTYVDPTTIMSDITKVLESGINNPDALLAFATNGMTADEVEAKIEAGDFDELVTNYMTNLEGFYKGKNGEMITALQNALGGSLSTQDYQALQSYWKNEGNFKDNFNETFGQLDGSVEGVTDELKNYVHTEEKYKTWLENKMAGIAEWMVQNPIAEVIVTTLLGGIGTLFGILMQYLMNKSLLENFTGGSGGSGGSGGNLKGMSKLKSSAKTLWNGKTGTSATGAPTQTVGMNKFFSLSAKPTGMSQIGGGATLGAGATALGGGVALIAGGTMAVNDYKKAEENGISGWKGAVGGYTDLAKNEKDVAKQVAGNTAKGALIGGGAAALGAGVAGMATGAAVGSSVPVIGTVIGAAVGLIAGVTVGLVEYNKASNVAARTTINTAKALETLQKSSEELHAAEEQLRTVTELATAAQEGDIDAHDKLINSSSNYKFMLDGLEQGSDEYNKVLDQIIALEKKKVADAAGKAVAAATKDVKAKDITKQTEFNKSNLKNSLIGQQIEAAAATPPADPDIVQNDGGYSTQDNKGNLVVKQKTGTKTLHDGTTISTYDEGTTLDLETYRKKLIDAGIDANDFTASQVWATANKIGLISIDSANIDKTIKDFDSSGLETTISNLQQAYQMTVDFSKNLATYVENYANWSELSDSTDLEKKNIDRLFAYYNQLHTFGTGNEDEQNAFSTALNMDWDTYLDSFPSLSDGENKATPLTLYNKYNKDAKFGYTPAFAVGTIGDAVIPYDNYLASLHEGEQIRTKAEVTVERAEQHVASSDSIMKVHDVLLTQTNTIINLLTNIYNVISSGVTSANAKKLSNIKYDLPGI